MTDGLKIDRLNVSYGKRQVIADLTAPLLPRGQMTILTGPNGCGKSTLLRALAGLNRAGGQAYLDGEPLLALPFARRAQRVVLLPQSLPQGVHLHVLESVLAARRASGGGEGQDEEARALALLAELGIAHLALSYLDQLSGGQRQLVGLAQSLIRQPSLLLLDEPLSALDLNHQFQVMEVVARETRRRNMVTVIVVHDLNIALRHGEQVLMLKAGELVASGAPERAITPANLATVYGVRARVERCTQGRPQLIVDGLIAEGVIAD